MHRYVEVSGTAHLLPRRFKAFITHRITEGLTIYADTELALILLS